MPMCDAFIPEGALPATVERDLLKTLTDLLLEHEGVDPSNENGQALAWVFVHRPQVSVAGSIAEAPYYKFVCSVPEGQYDDERRAAVTAEMTRAVVDAEAGQWPNPEGRVWVFTREMPDGTWGYRGRIFRLGDIAEEVIGPHAREFADRKLAARHRAEAELMLELAGEPA